MTKKALGIVFGLLLIFSTSASANIILDNWTIDLTTVDGGIPIVVNGVSEITYVGMSHAESLEYSNGDLSPYSVVDGLISATSLQSGGTNIPFTSLGDTWEMTFDFSVNNLNTSVSPDGSYEFTHLEYDMAAPLGIDSNQWVDGYLDIYVDNFANNLLPDGTFDFDSVADFTTGTGYRDGADGGVWIARFGVDAGEGGEFTTKTFDGSDDASFTLLEAVPGVLLHPVYGDLSQYTEGELEVLFAITDSNLDGDPLSNPADGYDIAVDYYQSLLASWPFLNKDAGGFVFDAQGNVTGFSAYLKEDGSVVLGVAVIPEPSTFLLLGAGLLGLGFISRKKMKK